MSICAIALLAPAGAAQAKVSAKVSVAEVSGGVRVVAVLSSTKKLGTRARPRSVRVRQGAVTFTLTRATSASAAKAYALGTWRSGRLTGDRAARARAIGGKPVTVLIRARSGSTTTVRTTAASPKVGGTTPGGETTPGGTTPGGTTPGGTTTPAPLFPAPGRELSGQEAIASMGKYFVNSEFSDCPAGHWPSCTVEQRYEHLEDGTFIYRRCTPTSGSDINYVNAYQVTGAAQHADGSWVIEYATGGGDGFYHWEVGQNGVVNGYYQFQGGSPEVMTNYVWRQPAYAADCYGS